MALFKKMTIYLFSKFNEKFFHSKYKYKIPNEIKIKIIDLETNEEYIPAYIQNINGGFVGKIQKECESVLTDIAEKCTIKEIFKSDYAKKIIKYISEKYKTEPEYLWDKTPNNAVFREKSSGKWYVALLEVEKKKLE